MTRGKQTYYVKKGKKGLYELRQIKFKHLKEEHPYDICAYAHTKEEMKRMRRKYKLY